MAHPLSVTELAARRPPICAAAPLLECLLPLIAGILCAKADPNLAIPSLLLCVGGVVLLRQRYRPAMPLAMALGSLLFGCLWTSFRETKIESDWHWRPPRECTVELTVDRLFRARREDRVAGIGFLDKTNLPLDTMSGNRVAFYLDLGSLNPAEVLPGTALKARGILQAIPAVRSPDGYQEYLQSQDVQLTLNQGEILQSIRPPPRSEQLRHTLQEKYKRLLTSGCRSPIDPGHVIASMLLGDRSSLTDDRIELYRKTGTFHLFAVSGLHVGSLALCLLAISTLLRLPNWAQITLILSVTWLYVWVTGATPSGTRSGIMLTTVFLAKSLLRQAHIFPALVLSATLVLIWQPEQLFQLGFQLSYAVVMAIVLIGLPLADALKNRLLANQPPLFRPKYQFRMEKAARRLIELVCIAISASVVSAPLIVENFNLLTPGGILASLLLNALVTLIVSGAAIAMLLAPILGELLAGTLVLMLWPAVNLIESILHAIVRLPGASFETHWRIAGMGTGTCIATLVTAWSLQRNRMERSQKQPLHPFFYALPVIFPALLIIFGTLRT